MEGGGGGWLKGLNLRRQNITWESSRGENSWVKPVGAAEEAAESVWGVGP